MGFLGRRSFWLPLIVVVLSSVGLAFVIARRRGELAELRQREAALEIQLASLKEENATLERERTQLLYDAASIERVAREHYGFVAPGEVSLPFAAPRRPVLSAASSVRGVDEWDGLLGCGGFPWRLPLVVCAVSAIVLAALDVVSAARCRERTG